MNDYLRNIWKALRGGIVVSPEFIKEHMGMILQLDEQHARIAKYDRRAAGQRIGRANRAIDKTATKEGTQ